MAVWSYSTHQMMRRCQLQLVFAQVLASHAAKQADRHEAYLLKQLQHLATWQGSVVHRVLATHYVPSLQRRQPVRPTTLISTAVDLARRQFAFSAARRFREVGLTKTAAGEDYCALFEHEYGWPITEERLATMEATVANCLQHLDGQTTFLGLLAAASTYAAERPLHFRLDDTTARAVPDLVLTHRNGAITIVDWKIAASEASDYSRQLRLYALAVLRCGYWPRATLDAVTLIEANLLKNEIRTHEVSRELLDDAEDFAYRSTVELRALLDGLHPPDVDWDEFEVAQQPNTCRHCNFHALCLRCLDHSASLAGTMEPIQEPLW
jgi:hypothetical protein